VATVSALADVKMSVFAGRVVHLGSGVDDGHDLAPCDTSVLHATRGGATLSSAFKFMTSRELVR
jgi:hypothetical protein